MREPEKRSPDVAGGQQGAVHGNPSCGLRGELNVDSIIVECSSGNTGIALAMAGAVLGCQVVILMSESASVERRHLIRQLGAGIRFLPAGGTYQDGIDLSRQMAAADPRIFLPRQFENPLNTEDHRQTTGMEILQQMEGRVDAFVSGYGTGGTLSGCGLAIKSHSRSALVVAMLPRANAALPGFGDCCFCIEGVAGHGFVPALLKQAPLDHTVEVDGLEALAMTRRLHRDFGLLVGTSSGANVLAALAIARELGPSARVVTVLCDRAERYFSTRLFEQGSPDASSQFPLETGNSPPTYAGGVAAISPGWRDRAYPGFDSQKVTHPEGGAKPSLKTPAPSPR